MKTSQLQFAESREIGRGQRRASAVLSGVVLVLLLMPSTLLAQTSGRKETPGAQDLQSRLSKAEESLLREYMDVVNEYYKKGEKEAAIDILKRVSAINPKLEGVQERIRTISEELLQENGLKLDLDVAKSWVAVCEVTEGKPFRITATGDYKMDLNSTVSVTGLSTADPGKDHVPGAPFGALIGLIVTDGKPGEPFPVNASLEHTPQKSGQLFLRVNVPASARCKGDLKLNLSGAIRPVPRKR